MESESRIINVPLECKLTEAEIHAAGKELADAINQRAQAENQLETFKQQVKAEIAQHDARIAKNTVLVSSEKEFRNVECEQVFDFNNGLKTTTRLDTGEVIRTEPLTNAERQQMMPGVA